MERVVDRTWDQFANISPFATLIQFVNGSGIS